MRKTDSYFPSLQAMHDHKEAAKKDPSIYMISRLSHCYPFIKMWSWLLPRCSLGAIDKAVKDSIVPWLAQVTLTSRLPDDQVDASRC